VKYRHDSPQWWQDDPLCEEEDADVFDWVDPTPDPEQALLAAEHLSMVRWNHHHTKLLAQLAQSTIAVGQLWRYLGPNSSLRGLWAVIGVSAQDHNGKKRKRPYRWDRWPDVRLIGKTKPNRTWTITVHYKEMLSDWWRSYDESPEDFERRVSLTGVRPSFLRMWDRIPEPAPRDREEDEEEPDEAVEPASAEAV